MKTKKIAILLLLPILLSCFLSVGSSVAYDTELSNYAKYKIIAYEAGEGAGVDYQVIVKCYYGSGTDGTEVLNGETVAKLYVGDIQADFDDVRFANQFGEILTHKRTSYSLGVSAVFVVKIEGNMDVDQLLYVYYGYLGAVDASSDDALIDVVGGVVLALPMNEGSGEPQDYSGNNQDGTISGATWVATGKYGNALEFDGDDKVTVTSTDTLKLTGNFTITAWVKVTTVEAGLKGLVTKDNPSVGEGYGLYVGNGVDEFDAKARIGGAWKQITTGALTSPTQYFASVTYDGVNLQTQINGAVSGSGTAATGAVATSNDNVLIGFYTGGGASNYAKAIISHVNIFSGALSLSNLLNMYNNYGDSTLVAGSVLVRKWATTTLPAVAEVSEETENSYYHPNPTSTYGADVSEGAMSNTDWWVSILVVMLIIINILLMMLPFALVRFVFGILSLFLCMLALSYAIPLSPYLQTAGLLISALAMLFSVRARE